MKISKLAAALTLGFVAAGGALVPLKAEAATLPTCLPNEVAVLLPGGIPTCLPIAIPLPTLPDPTLPGGTGAPTVPTLPPFPTCLPSEIAVILSGVPTCLPTIPGLPGSGGTGTGQVDPPSQSGVSGNVRISGKAKVGKKLHADLSAYSAPGYALSYQWLRNGAPITVKKHHKKRPATKASYKLVGKDRGKQIVLVVTAKKAGSQDVVNYAIAPKVKKGQKRP
jgi:hypothetical protein